MNAIAHFGFHSDNLFAMPNQCSQVPVYSRLSRTAVGPAVEQHGGNTHEIQSICTGLQILPLFFGIISIDVSYQVTFIPQCVDKIFSI